MNKEINKLEDDFKKQVIDGLPEKKQPTLEEVFEIALGLREEESNEQPREPEWL